MPSELVVFESQLKPLTRQFSEALGHLMPVDRMLRTIVMSCERNEDLLKCNRQTLMNAAMTLAVLGVEADGVTGQGYLVPFKNVVQPIIGYLGYNTIGARCGFRITGRVVREGDGFEHDESQGYIEHKRKLGGETGPQARRIIAAWAKAEEPDRRPIVRVMSVDELLAVKAKSQRSDKAPWADINGGYAAMCEKTVKRRLRRDMPLNVYQKAGAMEEAHEELGKHSWINPSNGGTVVVEGEVVEPSHNNETPTMQELTNPPSKEEEARMAAERGRATFEMFCARLSKTEYALMKPFLLTLKPVVEKAEHDGDDSNT